MVDLIRTTLRYINRHLLKLSWLALILLIISLFSFSWVMMWFSGEQELIKPDIWFYYFITTATTVGYGDHSPVTSGGRWIASLLLMPGAVVIFAGILGKMSTGLVEVWRKNMRGKGDFSDLKHHIVILGWHQEHTPRMISLIYGDARRQDRKVVLCASEEMENPFPDQVLFVQGEHLTNNDVLERSGVANADRVIIYRSTDDKTLSSCLTVANVAKGAHIVAWFDQKHMSELLESHCPQVECHSSISMELMVRSAQDPGSSRVQEQLLDTMIGPTQFSVQIPADFTGTQFSRLLEVMKQQHEALVLGVADSVTGNDLILNPAGCTEVKAEQLVYYMAAERINSNEIDWKKLAG
ncbi:hypothetical protein EOPP23_14600 [Endozoicomonas sp. OPT23]|uniref:ion channel n=1 Tax=Endozoicomonas sp. OPT23 TaxID=2072845 RepID=UPI00129AFFBE|nr:ion channel [Endozoicomonas sp. OPT23]MRI34221.1 hypothetical protein [Endozoicomonas sp. OPT23]